MRDPPSGTEFAFDMTATLPIAMAMLTDTIEYDRLRSGQRREGLYVGAFEFMQTTAFALGPLIAGFAFSAAGLVSGVGDPALQPPAALLMITLAMAVAPAICCALGMLMLAAYRLDRAALANARASRPLELAAP